MKKPFSLQGLLGGASMILTAMFSSHASAGTAFVHLFEWSWNDIASECEAFLGPKGFDAVQISPPQEHVSHSTWWARYQPITYTNLTSRSGSEEELQSMISRCNAAGVKVYADAVINHTAAWNGGGTGWGGTEWTLLNHPEFSPADYHSECTINNYTDADHVWYCRLLELPDLDTGSSYVQQILADYLNKLQDMGIAGFRVDAVKHMSPSDMSDIMSKAGNPWIFSEVIGADGEASDIQPYNYTFLGRVTEFKYGTDVASNFNGQIKNLASIGESWGLLSSTDAVNFIDNHDRERGHGGGGNLTYHDGYKYNLANVFMLAHPYGYPKIMSGYDFSDTDIGPPSTGPERCENDEWVCQHRWGNIANMVGFRNYTDGTSMENWWDNGDNQIAFGRGDKGYVVINNESNALSQILYTGLAQGDYCNILAGDDECSGEVISVGSNGYATFNVAAYSAAAIHAGQLSGPCGDACSGANFPSLYFRGTPNSWGTQAMTLVADHSWRTTVIFDGSSDQRFKFDVNGDWSQNYGDTNVDGTLDLGGDDIYTNVSGSYIVEVNDETLSYSLICADCTGYKANFSSLYFRGTPNSWGAEAMALVADHTWEIQVNFDGQSQQRFKFDVNADWSENYGDNNADGDLDQNGSDIYTSIIGSYTVQMNDQTMTYNVIAR